MLQSHFASFGDVCGALWMFVVIWEVVAGVPLTPAAYMYTTGWPSPAKLLAAHHTKQNSRD